MMEGYAIGVNQRLRFIDLFAGIGGFHLALEQLGHTCVFASESDTELAGLYEKNFSIRPYGDIRQTHLKVPAHDVLCAGFPCQPFSKAGEQRGFDCPESGDLFDYVLRILRRLKPAYLLMENVPNIVKHDGGRTWRNIKVRLELSGYTVDKRNLSPHMFGVPQSRDRVIIVGTRAGLDDFTWPAQTHQAKDLSIRNILEHFPADARKLSSSAIECLEIWQLLLDKLPKSEPLSAFPIWAMEFGADYPFQTETPYKIGLSNLTSYKGAFGRSLAMLDASGISNALPSYARTEIDKFPAWKRDFIQQNRDFYLRNKLVIDDWIPKLSKFAPSFQKLEWNWKDGPRDLWQTLIQFRASGIRAKRPTVAPSLVALTTSQVPVIAWERRYMTLRECARLQSMDALTYFPVTQAAASKALGNAVNVDVIAAVAKQLLMPIASQSITYQTEFQLSETSFAR